jgi:septum formation protein
MKHTLYLGSKSQSRQMLLREVQIPFILADQSADETACDWTLPLSQVVAHIARYKMDHVILPHASNDEAHCFVLTADTLSQNSFGEIHGKPIDVADAVAKIKSAREGMQLLSTAFCLDLKEWHDNAWHTKKRIERVVSATYEFIIPDVWIDIYLQKSWGLSASNAIAIEGFGGQFLKNISGSYSTIVGLPLFEVREALEELGFF